MDYTNPKVLGTGVGGGTVLANTGTNNIVMFLSIAVGIAILVILTAITIRRFHPIKK